MALAVSPDGPGRSIVNADCANKTPGALPTVPDRLAVSSAHRALKDTALGFCPALPDDQHQSPLRAKSL